MERSEQLLKKLDSMLERCDRLNHIASIINYDMETACCKNGAEDDAKDIDYVIENSLKITKSREYIDTIKELHDTCYDKLNEYQKRLVTLLYRDISKEEKLSEEFLMKRSSLFNKAYIKWIDCKGKSSYEGFKDTLKEIVESDKEYARLTREEGDQNAYDTIFSGYEYGFTSKDLDRFFMDLQEGITPLLKACKKSKDQPRRDFLSRKVDIHLQEKFSRELLKFNGFDFDNGSMSTTEHPFTSQLGERDVRVTTHYYQDNVISNMFSIIHEGGHALFGQNIPHDVFKYHLGEGSLSMAKHESVSRFYENIIGRSREYIHAIYPMFQEIFGDVFKDISEEELYKGVNSIDFTNSIRTEADELTYSLHIIVRYRIEKELLDGSLDIDDASIRWNQLYKELLDVDVKDEREGILQDVHWTSGFGYFPTYALGNALNCIYVKKMEKDFDYKSAVRNGDMQSVLKWMKENVFNRAALEDTKLWIKDITGEEFSAKSYIDYLTRKYSDIYHLQ